MQLLSSCYYISYLANISGSGVSLVFLSEGEADGDVLDLGVGGDGVVVAVDGNGHLRVGAEDNASQLLSKTWNLSTSYKDSTKRSSIQFSLSIRFNRTNKGQT